MRRSRLFPAFPLFAARRPWLVVLLGVLPLLAACSVGGTPTTVGGVTHPISTSTSTGAGSSVATSQPTETTPSVLFGTAYTPDQIRTVYGVTSLISRGYTGKGQTVVLIESYGSPTLQADLNAFDQQFGLPALTVKVMSPLGTADGNPTVAELTGWQGETTLDVETIHAIAPGAAITVLTSPVDETEGVAGLPQFLQLEQYAVSHHLGTIISQSWAASEVSLDNAAGKAEIAQWDNFYHTATTTEGITFFGSSGDFGAADCVVADINNGGCQQYTSTQSISFPSGDPWVTAAGGTTLTINGASFSQTAWSGSNGGFSRFFAEPSYQLGLPAAQQGLLNHRRGTPDIASSADPGAGLAIYTAGTWSVVGGTSAASPLWAGITAIADQLAGHPLGFLNAKLYKVEASSVGGQAFADITSGSNDNSQVGVQGYSATIGWDPVTGLGAPNAAILLPALIAA